MNGQWIGGYSGTNSGQLVIARKDLGHVLVQMRAHDDPQAVDLLGVRRHRISRQNPTSYVVKFKAEALPLKDEVGGYRLLFSHNVEFGLSQAPEGDRTSRHTLSRIFPCLTSELQTDADRVELVNQTIVEEVLQDLGTLDFGRGMAAKFNVAIWRERGMHRPLAGEFAFQVK